MPRGTLTLAQRGKAGNETIHAAPLYKEIADKRKILRDQYGGMMSLEDIKIELGYRSRESALAAAREMDIPVTRIGRMKKYDTDIVARRLVELRGMA
mgnify:CR=1 FL=1